MQRHKKQTQIDSNKHNELFYVLACLSGSSLVYIMHTTDINISYVYMLVVKMKKNVGTFPLSDQRTTEYGEEEGVRCRLRESE